MHNRLKGYFAHIRLVDKMLNILGTEVWVWTQFNKTKPEGSEWNVTLSADNYVLLVDSITTVAR